MIELIRFEWEKIFKRKSTLISLAIISLFTIWLFILPAFQVQTTDLQGKTYKGLSAVNIQKELIRQQPNVLTEEVLGAVVEEYQQIAANPASYIENEEGEKEFTSEIIHSFYNQNYALLSLVASTFYDPQYYTTPDYALKIPVEEDGTLGFYQQYQQNQAAMLARDIPENGGALTESAKSYWQKKTAAVSAPYRYGYYAGWNNIGDRIGFIPLLILMICLSLAPIFAGEYQNGTAVLILSSKFGKSKVLAAKVAAAYLFGLFVYGITMLLAFGGTFALFGSEGGELPIQLRVPNSPFPWTFSEMVWIHFGLGLLVLFGMIGVTLLLSSRLSTPVPVLVTNVLLLMMPFIMPKSTASVLYNWLVNLLPGVQLNMKFVSNITYNIAGWTTNLFTINVLVYLLIILVTVPLAIRSFREHQTA
ncbi:ABC transporter permease subunit [Enterococcus sp. LJL128]